MFESEIYYRAHQEEIPEDILQRFRKTYADLAFRSLLHWTEHCTECAMPACFKTCSLYSERIDGKCARFVNGMQNLEAEKGEFPGVLKIQFKKWGVLATQGNNHLLEVGEANKQEQKDLKIASLIHKTPAKAIKKKLIQKRYSVKKNDIKQKLNVGTHIPDYFTLECYNPEDKEVILNITIRNEDTKYSKLPFQFRVTVIPGYQCEKIPFGEIEKRIKTNLDYRIDIVPEDIREDHPLYFGLIEFAKFKPEGQVKKSEKKVKCVIWDLDNTVWQGTLTESGVDHLVLNPKVIPIITELEKLGVIHTIASKNNHDQAIAALEHFNIAQYFVFPKISWKPKSQSIRELIKDLNISADTFLFVDDSVFEREEIKSVFPQVRVLDAADMDTILGQDIFQVSKTSESSDRKNLYLTEQKRKGEAEDFEGEYLDFLKSCEMQLELLPLEKQHFERVYELTQRTNQMNFSGNLYSQGDIEDIASSTHLDKIVMRCQDKYGKYGIVGFAMINNQTNTLVDLMFSCRIQSKRVEHAFISFCLKKYLNSSDFRVKYKRTDRNKFSAQVFNDFNFELEQKEGNIHHLIFKKEMELPVENIVQVIA